MHKVEVRQLFGRKPTGTFLGWAQALAIYLCWLRCGENQEVLARRFGLRSVTALAYRRLYIGSFVSCDDPETVETIHVLTTALDKKVRLNDQTA